MSRTSQIQQSTTTTFLERLSTATAVMTVLKQTTTAQAAADQLNQLGVYAPRGNQWKRTTLLSFIDKYLPLNEMEIALLEEAGRQAEARKAITAKKIA